MDEIHIRNFIDGEHREAVSGNTIDDIDPSTGQAYTRVPDSDARDVELAVDAARRAFPGWSSTPRRERSRLLLAIADLIEANRDRLALAESIDNGKPVALARDLDIPRAASNFRFFATAILHSSSESHASSAGS